MRGVRAHDERHQAKEPNDEYADGDREHGAPLGQHAAGEYPSEQGDTQCKRREPTLGEQKTECGTAKEATPGLAIRVRS